jgi:hypothetical protein
MRNTKAAVKSSSSQFPAHCDLPLRRVKQQMGIQAVLVSEVFATVNTDVRTLACVGVREWKRKKVFNLCHEPQQ